MTIQISTADPRSIKALALLDGADRWQEGHTKDGRSFFAIPGSEPGLLHVVSTRECSCLDFRHRGAECKHILAVRLWVAKQPHARALRDGAPAHLAVMRAARNWPAVYPEVAAKAAIARQIWGSDDV